MDPRRLRPDGGDGRVLVDVEVVRHVPGDGVTGEDEHRGVALRGLGDARERVRQTAPLVDADDRHLAGGPAVGISHARRAHLVARSRERHTRIDQRVRHMEVATAHDAEDVRRTQRGDRPADSLGDRDPFSHCPLLTRGPLLCRGGRGDRRQDNAAG